MKIETLIAEDDETLRRQIASYLEGLSDSLKIQTADSTPSALAILKTSSNIRLLITDLRMPRRGDGEALIKEAKNLNPDLHVIVFSSSPEDLSRETRTLCFAITSKIDDRLEGLVSKIQDFLVAYSWISPPTTTGSRKTLQTLKTKLH